MPSLHSMFSVALAGLALSAVPGPSMLYVLSRAIGQSRAAGLMSALGLCLGGLLLAVATGLGLAGVFVRFDWLATAVQYLGSAYLIWLGFGMIWTARATARSQLSLVEVPLQRHSAIVLQGVMVEVLNPKTILALSLFLPQFVNLSSGPLSAAEMTWQLIILGAIVPLTAVPSDLTAAFVGSAVLGRLNGSPKFRQATAIGAGIVLIAIAVAIHWQDYNM